MLKFILWISQKGINTVLEFSSKMKLSLEFSELTISKTKIYVGSSKLVCCSQHLEPTFIRRLNKPLDNLKIHRLQTVQ